MLSSAATARIDDALVYMRTFVTHPHRGTENAKIPPGIRTETNKNFIFYFEVDDLSSEVRIIAIFFGGVDHRQQIMDRLRNGRLLIACIKRGPDERQLYGKPIWPGNGGDEAHCCRSPAVR